LASNFIGFEKALRLTLDNISCLAPKETTLLQAAGLVAASDLTSQVDAPSSDISLKDGYALISSQVDGASRDNPVRLNVLGTLGAGEYDEYRVEPGSALNILTGATIPPGADAVAAQEFTRPAGSAVEVLAPTGLGRNILPRGSDVAKGQVVVKKGQTLTPGLIGLLAAGGMDRALVYPRPGVTIIASGDEVVPPGQELPPGKVYASNLMTLAAWCDSFGLKVRLDFVRDDPAAITRSIETAIEKSHAVITIGGAWSGAKDWMARVLNDLGWNKLYHRVRLGPGKAVGFGLLQDKPVFALPGGPPSNLMAFLQLALPGILKLAGRMEPPFLYQSARMMKLEKGQSDWTDCVYGELEEKDGERRFWPIRGISRLRRIALAQAIAIIPEGRDRLEKGDIARVQVLR
jgi:molybdopterin molybdotransferase